MPRLLPLLLLGALLVRPAAAETMVDLELVLLSDASGSIDAGEIRLQREGWAAALTDPEVLQAIAVQPLGRIAVSFVEWGDAAHQDVVVPWTVIDGRDSAEAFAAALLAAPRRAFGRNAIGSALAFAERLLESNGIAGERRIVDLSADSANSFEGPPIEPIRARLVESGVTINGLAILCRDPACSGRPVGYDLEAVFARTIIGGPGSFVVPADRRTSFAEAARRKLLLEVADGRPPVRLAQEPAVDPGSRPSPR